MQLHSAELQPVCALKGGGAILDDLPLVFGLGSEAGCGVWSLNIKPAGVDGAADFRSGLRASPLSGSQATSAGIGLGTLLPHVCPPRPVFSVWSQLVSCALDCSP